MNNFDEKTSQNIKKKSAPRRKRNLLKFLFADAYVVANEKWKSGFFYRIFRKRKQNMRSKARIAQLYENSLICRIVEYLSDIFIHSQLRMWGIALLFFSFAVLIATFAQNYFSGVLNQTNIIVGAAFAVLSVPFMASKKQFGEAMLTGKITSHVVYQVLGLDETRLQRKENDGREIGYSYLFLIAILLGLATYFVDPILIIDVVGLIIAFAVIMSFPELGIMSVLAIIPFSNLFGNPTIAVLFFVCSSAVSFVVKFLRGKRVIRFELMDVLILVFGVLMLFGGVFARSGGTASLDAALTYCAFMSVYFLIVNAYIRKTWLYRVVNLIVVTTAFISLVGIIEGGVISASWVDMSQFAHIGERISSFLGNPNMLGVYLVIVFPLALSRVMSANGTFRKVSALISMLLILVCTVMTWSRGAWLGIIVSFIVFFLVCNFKNIWFLLAGACSIPLWAIVLPQSIIDRFLSILTMSDSSITYRVNTWRGVWRMIRDHLFSGIGVGEQAFRDVYPAYAIPGTETVMHSHNIFMQIALELGIIGLLIFVFILVMYMQKAFRCVGYRRNESKSRITVSAGFAGIVGACVAGFTDHIWYNYRVFLIFWIVVALTMAFARIDERERFKENARFVNNSRSADLDL